MTCSRCGGDMEPRTVRFCVPNVSPPIMIENVPAQVCTRCAGEVFSDSTVAVLEKIRDGRIPHRIANLRVFNFEEAEQTNGADGNGARADNVVDIGTAVTGRRVLGAHSSRPYDVMHPGTRARYG